MSVDAFSAEIIALVRRMPDEAILALVRNQLAALQSLRTPRAAAAPSKAAPVSATPPPPKPKPAAPAKAKRAAGRPARTGGASPKPRGRRIDSAQRVELVASVERVVKAAMGLSASEVAKLAGAPQPRVATALKELKLAKRIFQGGDRRFARYAGDAKTADQASLSARENASGPARAGKAAKKTKKK
jgi:hypothetical protein